MGKYLYTHTSIETTVFGMLQVEAYTHSIPYPGLRSPSDGSPKLVTLGHITFGLYFVEKLSKASSILCFFYQKYHSLVELFKIKCLLH